MFQKVKYQSGFLLQWNTRLCHDITEPLVDKVVEAVLYNQEIPFEHTSEYRNVYSYDKLWQQLKQYDPEIVQGELDIHMKAGSNRSFKNFARPKDMPRLKPVSLIGTAQELFVTLGIKRDTAAGLTAYGETKFEAFVTGLDKAVKILTQGKAPAPCLAGVRTQRKGKTRLVWGYPLEMTIIEAIIARPLINYFKSNDSLMSFGKTSHEIGMKMRSSCSTCSKHYSIDYSAFDSSVRADFIRAAFGAFRTWYQLDAEVYPGVTVADVFSIVETYFITTPIVMPNKDYPSPTLCLGKRRGVPSGSYFTQIVDSFANATLLFGCSSRFQLGVKEKDVYILGDDCLFFANRDIDLNQLSQYVSRFGFKLNPTKGGAGVANQVIEYLGRDWKNGFPIRQWSNVIRGALYPEKYRKYSPMPGARQMEAINVLNSYLLTSYVEDCPIGTQELGQVFTVSERYSSGLTRYLMSSGLIPGKVFERSIF